ncbi:MAG: mandelate racemase/muconate lactonizing enzyme family protein [Dehalococcoidales bacterium]|nr:mandelate racemase/muconate lactonizing enzyme family protein [Dehalococcoidales bacterium]
MKINSVEIWDVDTASLPVDHPVMVRINTDDGISGLGEVGLAYGTGHTAGAGYVKNLAETFLIGADPMQTEKLWDVMFRSTFWAQGGGPVVFGAMSAIDIACWDIKGKALKQPVYQLLGGKTNDNLRAYASQIQFGWDRKGFLRLFKPVEYAEAARITVAEGYDAVKVDPIFFDENGSRTPDLNKILKTSTVKMVYERIKAIREAVGDDVDILIELHSAPNVTSAIQIGQALEEFHCMFFEEGVHYLNPALQDKLARNVKIPMAAGERLYTRWGYRQYFEDQSLNMIQPDLCLVGGLTEGKKVCDYAHVYDITVQLHVCGSPISTAASLQLEAVIPNFQIHEHHTNAIKPGNRELCVPDYQPVKGRYAVPDLPGLGLDLNEKVISQHPCVTVK